MPHSRLRQLVFLALCCDFGLFAKKLIAPIANVITDFLRIPGGISTGFSLMFVVIAAALVPKRGCATLMSLVQSLIALALGRMGSMGLLSPIGYILPGVAIDCSLLLMKRLPLSERLVFANSIASVAAALTANCIVFRLTGMPLLLYVCVAATSGSLCGLLACKIVPRVRRAVSFPYPKED